MVLSIARPTRHPKSGVYRARKVVPEDLRAVIGKRELIASLRTKDPAEAKARHAAAMATLEARLTAARAEVAGTFTRLTARQIAEIAGEVYRAPALGVNPSDSAGPFSVDLFFARCRPTMTRPVTPGCTRGPEARCAEASSAARITGGGEAPTPGAIGNVVPEVG
ncbi:DUF6538 domain-containing protein [Neoroseomonas oryzicola]|uniref:DUF6538 domain-containing protein n=1 Tax=Neoroseomonas oryzicola TaxID=535904 RepID=UPI0038D12741